MGGSNGKSVINPNRNPENSAHRPFVSYETVEKGLGRLEGNQAIKTKSGSIVY